MSDMMALLVMTNFDWGFEGLNCLIDGDEEEPSDVDEGRWKKTKMLAIGLICLYLGDSVHVFDRGLHVDDA